MIKVGKFYKTCYGLAWYDNTGNYIKLGADSIIFCLQARYELDFDIIHITILSEFGQLNRTLYKASIEFVSL